MGARAKTFAHIKCKLEWQRRVARDAVKAKAFKESATRATGFRAYLCMLEGKVTLMPLHSVSEFDDDLMGLKPPR